MRRSAVAVATLAVVLAGCGSHARVARHVVPPAPRVVHRRRARRPLRVAVPILMFHVIGSAPLGARFPQLYDPAATFDAQLRWLRAQGFHAVTMQRVWNAWTRGVPLPARPIVLTFDDGYPGDWRTALPLLQSLRWDGVLNLQVGNLESRHVLALVRAGWEIDAHTFTHPNLTLVGASRLRHEVAGSRAWIRRAFGVPVDFFAYPSGRYDSAVVAAVRAAGFLGAETTHFGYAELGDGRFTLDRIRVNGDAGVVGLAAALGRRA